MDYSQINAPSTAGGKRMPGLTVDKTCKLLSLRSHLYAAVAIVFGLLGVTLIVRYFSEGNETPSDERSVSGDDIATWMRS